MDKNQLSPKAIFDFMKVFYEVTGKVIPYEQAEDEANRLISLMTLVLTSDKIRTMKALAKRHISPQRRGKKRKTQV